MRRLRLKAPEDLDAGKDQKRRPEEALALDRLVAAYSVNEDLRRFWGIIRGKN